MEAFQECGGLNKKMSLKNPDSFSSVMKAITPVCVLLLSPVWDTLLISTYAKIHCFLPNRVKIRLIRVKEKLNPVMGFEKNLNLLHEQE